MLKDERSKEEEKKRLKLKELERKQVIVRELEVSQAQKVIATGTGAIAQAVKMADVDVISAYPIRPYTGVMNTLAKMIANGEFDAEYIIADSEHTQFEIAKHAAAAGARVFTGSAGIGVAYAHEALVVTPSYRVPVVAMTGNRALDDPGNFGPEHNETLTLRDLGWLIAWPETPEEAFDLVILSYKISEDPRVLLPSITSIEGGFITHAKFPVVIPPEKKIREFLPSVPPKRPNVLDPETPLSIGPQVNDEWGMELRKQLDNAVEAAREVIKEAHRDYNRIIGRGGPPFIEEINTDGADIALITVGGATMMARATVRELAKEGKKVGIVKIRRIRPFPYEELAQILPKFKAVGVLDINFSYGSPFRGGIIYQEVRSSLYDVEERPVVVDFLCVLGGRQVVKKDMMEMVGIVDEAAKKRKDEKKVYWIGLRQ
jgi:pyruvate ferredoxin oxidoreductase alpha subunit